MPTPVDRGTAIFRDVDPSGPIAVGYELEQRKKLTAFVHDPDLPIHTILAERGLMRQALNHKNSPFAGNPHGGETAAILSSSCCRHGVDPQ